ncbi:MAG: asparagine synthase (glutamine-hydrolyzing) [Solirubrobacterales bacterium]
MGGIAGIFDLKGRPVARAEVANMCSAIVHRGPDAEGTHLSSGLSLGMRRLAIIDLSTGDQPLCNEDGTVWVVFNGEIYNYRELRRELAGRGHRFRTTGDTEVLVHLYEERGQQMVDDLRGMFAFALWDERRQRLLLGRDRLGIKPLYYAVVNGRLLFASELKALLRVPELERRINWMAFSRLLASLTTPPSESILAGVNKLEPAHVLTADPHRGIRVERYWDVRFAPIEGRSEQTLVDQVRELLDESVRLHLVSDVPVGAFLSGGIDSSGVVAHMARSSPRQVKTFSIGFREADFSETAAARLVADAFDTEHHERILETDTVAVVGEVAFHLDEPFGDSSAIPTYLVSKLAAEHVKVVLSGDGGDELFAGYDRYLVEARERKVRHIPVGARRTLHALARRLPGALPGRRFASHMTLPEEERYLDAVTLFDSSERDEILRPELRELLARHDPWREERRLLARRHGDWLAPLQHLDMTRYLPLDVLTKVDRMSMAHSLEVRVPLLDHRLVEFAATLPLQDRLRGRSTKHLLRRALRGLVPDAILDGPKHGFAIPLGRWFQGPLGGFARDLLLSPHSFARDVFERPALERLLRGPSDGDLGLKLWTVLSFELWCRAYLAPGSAPRLESRPPFAVPERYAV